MARLEQAAKEEVSYAEFLDQLLACEIDAKTHKHLQICIAIEEFDFSKCPSISAQQIHELARGDYLVKAEPVIFIGESGTGKTHLLTGLAVAACRQKRRVRFTTAAALVNELVEAKHQLQLSRALARWRRREKPRELCSGAR